MSSYLTFGSFTKEETEKMGLPLIPLGPRVIYHNIPKSSKVITFGSLTLQETVSMGFSLLEIRYPALLCERCKRSGHSINDCYSDTTYDGTPINDFVYKIHKRRNKNPRKETPSSYRSLWLDAELKSIYSITNQIMQEHASHVPNYTSNYSQTYSPTSSTLFTYNPSPSGYVYPLPY